MGPTAAEIDRLSTISYATLVRRAVRQGADAASPLHQPGDGRCRRRRRADQRSQLLRLVVEPGARRRRPAAPARRVRAVRDLRRLVRRTRPCRRSRAASRRTTTCSPSKAFGNFRNLLEGVTYHPMMGIYLSHLKNQKEDPTTGRVPDQNFAREIMQLFTIGLYKLNADGTPADGAMASRSRPIRRPTSTACRRSSPASAGTPGPTSPIAPTRASSAAMPTSSATGGRCRTTTEYTPNTQLPLDQRQDLPGSRRSPPQTTPDPAGDLKIALDTLFNHPNVGPFIGKQLIQRLVTSNPSPAYVARVARGFNNNGSGVRGDMKAVGQGDPARPRGAQRRRHVATRASASCASRCCAWRTCCAPSTPTRRVRPLHRHRLTDDPATALDQTPLFAPTVFNFFRPGYVPPGARSAQAGLVAPEMQIDDELSVAGYMNYIRTWTRSTRPRHRARLRGRDRARADAGRPGRAMNLLPGGGRPMRCATQCRCG